MSGIDSTDDAPREDWMQTWQSSYVDRVDSEVLLARVTRVRRRRVLLRTLELVMTLVAFVVLLPPVVQGQAAPEHWLLLPFFAVFLPWVWWHALNEHKDRQCIAVEAGSDYVRLRAGQIDIALKQIRLFSLAAHGLLVYAVIALVVLALASTLVWQRAATVLVLWALLWWLGTHFLVGIRRRRLITERRRLEGLG